MRSLHFETGMCIVVGGMFVHVAVFGQFLFSEFLFLSRFYKTSSRILQLAKSFVILNNILLIGSIFIFIRSVVRVVEFILEFSGTVMQKEVFLYVFDAVPMFLTTFLYKISLFWKTVFQVQKESVEAQLAVHPTYPSTIQQEIYYDTNVYKF